MTKGTLYEEGIPLKHKDGMTDPMGRNCSFCAARHNFCVAKWWFYSCLERRNCKVAFRQRNKLFPMGDCQSLYSHVSYCI